ncbi:outer membrane beta-barrel protein [Mesorhizobium sp. BR1-1-16]|uniref:outer membrane beta-barrel protein n=1 Tax=Mesorhizobium sp. BR1-1-16 TaxID=2876653 RepID=UPI001CCFB0A9|nr:outer membrane beta-barrel protein [Mesorhizobium sp. BR1-1-16]MBZ9934711.1 outer membrane beta-barrel protein [Mesorhizobium sp. BR1-1-16]
MRVIHRTLLSATLIAALAPMSAARAQSVANGSGPGIAFDTSDDFSSLRGTDSGQPVEISNQQGIDATDDNLTTTTPDLAEDGKVTRVQGVQPVTGNEDDGPAKRSKTSDARDETAYDPTGIRVGSFILLPAVELRGGYTSNAAQSSTGGPSGTLTIAPDILLKSDWASNEFQFRLKGDYEYFTDTSVKPDSNLYVEANGRIDLPRDWALRLKADYIYDTQSSSQFGYPEGVQNPPGINTYDAGATLDGSVGRTVLQLRGTATYTGYDPLQVDNVAVTQAYLDNTLINTAARIGYQWTPTIAPFVEAEISNRLFENPNDPSGYSRNSRGITLRGGIAYSADPILKGEIALGWRHETYDDSRFAPFDLPTIDASLIWSPSPLTQVAFVAATYVDPATDINASSTIVYDLGLSVERYVRRNFTLAADVGWQHQHYIDADVNEITYEAGIQGTWKLNREAWIVGRLEQQYFASAVEGGSYPTTTATIGLRLQR